MNIFNFYW